MMTLQLPGCSKLIHCLSLANIGLQAVNFGDPGAAKQINSWISNHTGKKIDRLIADKQALAADVLADGGEIPLTEMRDDELLKFVSLDLRAAAEDA